MAEPLSLKVYQTPAGLTVTRVQPAIGAQVSGVRLAEELSPEVFADLRAALLAHGVLFFRDQEMTYERHVALGKRFGDLVLDGTDPTRPEIVPVKVPAGAKDKSASRWHSDGTYMAVPPAISILRAIDVKPFGGDTGFASGVAAYEGLSDEMKARIADLRFTSEMAWMLRRAGKDKTLSFGSEETWRALELKYPRVEHPVVRVHPETGQPVLYINEGQGIDIVGMEDAEGRELMRSLTDQFKRPEYQVRWSWENHSIAIWDNRAVQHYGVPDPQYDRYLERVTVMGAPPLSLREWDMAEQPG